MTGSPSAIISLGLGAWGSPGLIVTMGYGQVDPAAIARRHPRTRTPTRVASDTGSTRVAVPATASTLLAVADTPTTKVGN